jgi:hypothetical protein
LVLLILIYVVLQRRQTKPIQLMDGSEYVNRYLIPPEK